MLVSRLMTKDASQKRSSVLNIHKNVMTITNRLAHHSMCQPTDDGKYSLVYVYVMSLGITDYVDVNLTVDSNRW